MDIILNPFVTLLTLLYAVLGSMVLAIVVFTILVRLATYPLTAQQMKSSQAMSIRLVRFTFSLSRTLGSARKRSS